MIISFLNTKGGAGKTSSLLTLLSAFAERATAMQSGSRILAIDADPQGSLTDFFQRRAARQIDHNPVIDFEAVDLQSLNSEKLFSLKRSHDTALIDFPGFYTAEALKTALQSDIVLVPSNLGYTELRESMTSYGRKWVMGSEKAAYRGGCRSLPELPKGTIRLV